MSQESRPWAGISTGDAGPYSDANWVEMYRLFYGIGTGKNDGGPLIGTGTSPDIGLSVTVTSPVSAAVILTPGAALVHGTWYHNDANLNMALGANASGNPRVDTLVLRKDWSAQTVRAAIKQGTPAATPVPPGMTRSDGSIWEIPIADIAVANGFSSIAAADITSRRIFGNAADGLYPFDILNNSGGTLETGDVVKWDLSADRAVTTTVLYGDPLTAGVWVGRTANGEYGRVLYKGIGLVKANGAVTRGDVLIASSTVKKVMPVSSSNLNSKFYPVGMALETIGAAGFITAMIDLSINRSPAAFATARNNAGDYSRNSATLADIDSTNLKATLMLSTGRVEILLTGTFYTDAGAGHVLTFDVAVDGVAQGHVIKHLLTADATTVPYATKLTGLTAGQRAITIQWSVAAGTVFLFSDATSKVLFSVVEF